jgi:hypothetical protein
LARKRSYLEAEKRPERGASVPPPPPPPPRFGVGVGVGWGWVGGGGGGGAATNQSCYPTPEGTKGRSWSDLVVRQSALLPCPRHPCGCLLCGQCPSFVLVGTPSVAPSMARSAQRTCCFNAFITLAYPTRVAEITNLPLETQTSLFFVRHHRASSPPGTPGPSRSSRAPVRIQSRRWP